MIGCSVRLVGDAPASPVRAAPADLLVSAARSPPTRLGVVAALDVAAQLTGWGRGSRMPVGARVCHGAGGEIVRQVAQPLLSRVRGGARDATGDGLGRGLAVERGRQVAGGCVEREESRHRQLPQPSLGLLVVGWMQSDHVNRVVAQACHDVEVEAAEVEGDEGDLADSGLRERDQLGDVGAATCDRHARHALERRRDRRLPPGPEPGDDVGHAPPPATEPTELTEPTEPRAGTSVSFASPSTASTSGCTMSAGT